MVNCPMENGGSFQFGMLVITRGYLSPSCCCLVSMLAKIIVKPLNPWRFWLQRLGLRFTDVELFVSTLWLFNIAMDNGGKWPIEIDDFPIKTSIYWGFSMAMLNNQMVQFISNTLETIKKKTCSVTFLVFMNPYFWTSRNNSPFSSVTLKNNLSTTALDLRTLTVWPAVARPTLW